MIEGKRGLGEGRIVRTVNQIEFGWLSIGPKGTIDPHGHYDGEHDGRWMKHLEIWWTFSPMLLINGRRHFFYVCRNGEHWAENKSSSCKMMHYFKLWW